MGKILNKLLGKDFEEKEADAFELEKIRKENDEYQKFVDKIQSDQTNAEGGNRSKINREWEDEYKMFIGDQWNTTKGYRKESSREKRLNSVDNYIFSTIMNIHCNITATIPDVTTDAIQEDFQSVSDKLNDIIPYVLYKNNFSSEWKDIVLQFLNHGVAIGYVHWDANWIGGSGPNRWIGDVRVQFQDKDEIYFDPAIKNLEKRLQECGFITRKFRKKISWIREVFKERGQLITSDTIPVNLSGVSDITDEGTDPQQATVIEYWHKGVPKFISKEDKQRFLDKASEMEAQRYTYKAQEYRDMANGTLKGVHVCYSAGGTFLEYVPYMYYDGLYPFTYKVLYKDIKQPYGFGEIKNMIMPQIVHNLADEIQVGAMEKEGLGGAYYQAGSLTKSQKDTILKNGWRGNQWFEVMDVNGIKDRTGVKVPNSIVELKAEKKNVIDTVSQNTAILQGQGIGSRTPYSVIQELGQRADMRTKGKIEILQDFMVDIARLMVNRITEFYNDGRVYRVLGNNQNAINSEINNAVKSASQIVNPQDKMMAMDQIMEYANMGQAKTGTYNRNETWQTWERSEGSFEEFVPDLDIRVKIQDEKPMDRNYYVNLAKESLASGVMGIQSYWQTIDEGKLPSVKQIVAEVESMRQSMQPPMPMEGGG